MKTFSATDAKIHFGEVLAGTETDSATIQRRGHSVAMLLPFSLARRLILFGYSKGGMHRGMAMELLGMTWYGQLLDALANEGMDLPELPAAVIDGMVSQINNAMDVVGQSSTHTTFGSTKTSAGKMEPNDS